MPSPDVKDASLWFSCEWTIRPLSGAQLRTTIEKALEHDCILWVHSIRRNPEGFVIPFVLQAPSQDALEKFVATIGRSIGLVNWKSIAALPENFNQLDTGSANDKIALIDASHHFGKLNEKQQLLNLVVASTNPVKIQAALAGFQAMFPDQHFQATGVNVPSGVSAQPMTSIETRQGALNRATAARQCSPGVAYWVGIEGGCEDNAGELDVFAWVVVLSRDREQPGISRTATFALPQEVATLVRQGIELGEADDRVFGRSNSKQQNGSVGLLTADVITRLEYYRHAVILALIPFKNAELTFGA